MDDMKPRNVSPIGILYMGFVQSVTKTPRKVQRTLTEIEEFGQTLTENQRSKLEDLTGTLYDQAEERGFRHGFLTAKELWEEYLHSK